LVAATKFWVPETKNLFVVPNFVAVTKPFFPCIKTRDLLKINGHFGFVSLNKNELKLDDVSLGLQEERKRSKKRHLRMAAG